MIFLPSRLTRTWLRLVSHHPKVAHFRFLSSNLETGGVAADSLANGSFYQRLLCHPNVGERALVVNSSINFIWPVNDKRILNMEETKGDSANDQPANTENGDLISGIIVEDEELIDVTDINQKDSAANQNSSPTGNFTQGQALSCLSYSKHEMKSDQHASDGACELAVESDEFSGKSPNLNSLDVTIKGDDDLIMQELSNDETIDTEKSFQSVNNQNEDDLNCDNDNFGLDILFEESLQCVDASRSMMQGRPKSRQRRRGKRKLNALSNDVYYDDESLGLENLFDEDLPRRDAARWAIQSKLKPGQKKKEKRKRKRQLNALSDDDDDTDTASMSVNKDDSSSSKPQKKPKRIMPNYFIAIRVSNPHIHSGVKIVQDSVVTHNEKLKPALIPLSTLHLTLLVVHLEDQEQVQKATEILHQCRTSLEPILQNSALTLNFTGLDHFRHQVLFVKLCGDEGIVGLNTVANIVSETFAKEGIPSTDSREFNPHLTIMKLTRSPKLRKKGIKKIPVESYATWADLNFGEERVGDLHLCSMNVKDKDGFYKCVATVKFEADNEPDSKAPLEPGNVPTDDNIKALENDMKNTTKEHQGTNASTDPGDVQPTASVGENIKESDSCIGSEELSRESETRTVDDNMKGDKENKH